MAVAAAGQLRRSLGASGVLVLTLAALSPAASVFVTGAAVLRFVGSGAVLAVLIGGGVTLIATALYAELGGAYPHAGGVYYGIGEVLGRRWGMVAMALSVATAPALLAFAALGLATYARTIAPGLPTLVIADGAILAALGVGLLSIRAGLWVTGGMLLVELGVIAVLVALGVEHQSRSIAGVLVHPLVPGLHGLAVPGAANLAIASIMGAYACSGSSLAINFGEDALDPARTVSRVILWGGVLSIALVVLPITAVVIGAPDLAAILSAEAPIAAVLRAIAGPAVASALAIGVTIAIFDHIASALIAYSRLFFAAARSWPGEAGPLRLLARIEAKSGAPAIAAAVLGVIAAAMTLIGQRGLLLLISGELVTPALMIVAVLVGRKRGQTGAQSYRSPFYPALPVVGLGVLAIFLAADLCDPVSRLSVLLVFGITTLVARPWRRLLPRSVGNRRPGSPMQN